MNFTPHRRLCAAPLLFLAFGAAKAADPGGGTGAPDLASLSIEQLTQVEVTSVGRKDQKLSQVAAAVFVITSEDIRRSGVSNVPELLRMVPGIQVAQIAANIWAISSRGFNGRGSDKILVLVDGRSIYNSFFSGTFWDQNLVPLDEIERIEVVRGPGATMWGTNAVDGVISIVTKKSKDTQGTLLTVEAGQTNRPDGDIQFGGKGGQSVQYRLEAGYGEHPGMPAQTGGTAWDRWNSGHGDLRLDWQATPRDSVSVEGSAYQGGGDQNYYPLFPRPSAETAVAPFTFSGGDAMGRWQHQFSGSDIAFETYFTRENRAEEDARGFLDTTDFDFQHHIPLGRNDFIWGLEYRRRTSEVTTFSNYRENLYSIFAQDEITLIRDRLTFTAGARVQYVGTSAQNNFDVQPQGRLLWTPAKNRSFWSAVSRVVREPSEIERELYEPFALPAQNGIPAMGVVLGNQEVLPEIIVAYEAGYRQQIARKLTFDVSVFLDHNTGLIATVAQTPYVSFNPGPEIVVPEQWQNGLKGDTRGMEFSATWNPVRRWRLQAGYAREDAVLGALPGDRLTGGTPETYWRTPRNTLDLRSGWDLTHRWSVDSTFSWVSRIPSSVVPHYTRVDLHIARRIGEGGEISAGVRNLFDREHLEFISEDYTVSSLVRRDVYVKVMWRF